MPGMSASLFAAMQALPAIFNKRTGASHIHETLPLEFPKEPADQASLLSRYS